MDGVVRLLVVGAHPDDADINAGGMAIKYARNGHEVRFLSMTDGSAGHHELSREEIVRTREQEANAAAEVAGIEYRILDNPDGALEPSLENRRELIREIRSYAPDLVLTHRTEDYHPDHRYTARLVRDSAYMVTVPRVCPETPALREDPVIGYLPDRFSKPTPFDPDIVIDIDDAIEQKLEMLACHESQFFEWLPYNQQLLDEVPDGTDARMDWLRSDRLPAMRFIAQRYRSKLQERYGHRRGNETEYAEAIEISEYGSSLTREREGLLFPF